MRWVGCSAVAGHGAAVEYEAVVRAEGWGREWNAVGLV